MPRLMIPGEMLCFGSVAWPVVGGQRRRTGRLVPSAAGRFHCSSRMRNMRRSGSAAPHSNWSPIV